MTPRNAIIAFSALAHPVRLALFQKISSLAPAGAPAGELAQEFDIPPSTMTGHLQALERAGLIRAERRSRFMLYSLNLEGARQMVSFLIFECCGDKARLLDGLDLGQYQEAS